MPTCIYVFDTQSLRMIKQVHAGINMSLKSLWLLPAILCFSLSMLRPKYNIHHDPAYDWTYLNDIKSRKCSPLFTISTFIITFFFVQSVPSYFFQWFCKLIYLTVLLMSYVDKKEVNQSNKHPQKKLHWLQKEQDCSPTRYVYPAMHILVALRVHV